MVVVMMVFMMGVIVIGDCRFRGCHGSRCSGGCDVGRHRGDSVVACAAVVVRVVVVKIVVIVGMCLLK